jgi:hypothetical protein
VWNSWLVVVFALVIAVTLAFVTIAINVCMTTLERATHEEWGSAAGQFPTIASSIRGECDDEKFNLQRPDREQIATLGHHRTHWRRECDNEKCNLQHPDRESR